MKPSDSETIISLKERRSKTGMPVGELGSITPEVLAKRLAAKRTIQVEADLASRASLRGVVLQIEDDYHPEKGLVFRGVRAVGSQDACLSAAADYRLALTPATQEMIEDWLAELSVIAPSRADDEITVALRIAAYSSRLSEYPADIAREALLSTVWKFFPSWAELRERCEALLRRRDSIIRELERAADREHEEVPEWQRTTAEERRASAVRIMADVFGGKRIGEA